MKKYTNEFKTGLFVLLCILGLVYITFSTGKLDIRNKGYNIFVVFDEVSGLENRAKTLASHIHEVSRAKSELAFSVVSALASRFESVFPILEHASFILAGDIVYNMAHDVPRPERSTGKLVKGSDLDLVVVVDRHVPERIVKRLDDAIYQEKYRLLIENATDAIFIAQDEVLKFARSEKISFYKDRNNGIITKAGGITYLIL